MALCTIASTALACVRCIRPECLSLLLTLLHALIVFVVRVLVSSPLTKKSRSFDTSFLKCFFFRVIRLCSKYPPNFLVVLCVFHLFFCIQDGRVICEKCIFDVHVFCLCFSLVTSVSCRDFRYVCNFQSFVFSTVLSSLYPYLLKMLKRICM